MSQFNYEKVIASNRDSSNHSEQNATNNAIPIRCNTNDPCPICGGIKTQCYHLPEEIWCISTQQPSPGWEIVGVTQSGQSRFKAVKVQHEPDKSLALAMTKTKSNGDQMISEDVNDFLAPPVIDKEDLQAVLTEIVNFVRSQRQFPDLESVIPSSLMNAFSILSKRLNIPEIIFVSMLLLIASSLLPIGTTIEIDPSTNFYPPPILWVGIVAESGATKSLPLRILLLPLKRLQARADQIYKSELKNYKECLKLWEEADRKTREDKPKPPTRREYYLQDTTIEAIAEVLAAQSDRGIIQAVDEIAGWFNSLNQYRRGQGNDRQKWLSMYDGGAIKVQHFSAS
jgi:hypothetical protein